MQATIGSSTQRKRLTDSILKFHAQRIRNELRLGGADSYDLLLPETHYLPFIINPDEHILGSVYGKYPKGRGVLVVTDQRVLFIDKKPLFVHYDEIDFSIIGGVTNTKVALSSIVTLHTQMGDFVVRTLNHRNAQNFVYCVEDLCLNKDLAPRRMKNKFMKGDDDDTAH
jgi:hypothetical protein